MTTNHNIKIPGKHYVTMQARDKNVPLGFLTPFGTDSGAKKRMATADSWAYGWRQKGERIEPKTLDNVLLTGFKVAHSVQRYSTSNVVWRVVDPRGFELEISSGNMSDLIGSTTIEQGEIQERCIWGRQGANNVLLNEDDPEYVQAIANSARIEKKVSLRDLKVGNIVVLANGKVGQYMGCFHIVSMTYGNYNDGYSYAPNQVDKPAEIKIAKSPKHFFLINNVKEHWHGDTYMGISSPKISEISDASTVLDLKDTEKQINDRFMNCEADINSASDSEYRAIGVIARTKNQTAMKIDLTHLADPQAFVSARNDAAKTNGIYWTGNCLIAEIDGNWINSDTSAFQKNYNHHGGRKDLIHGNTVFIDALKNDCQKVLLNGRVYGEKTNHGRHTPWASSREYYDRIEAKITDCEWHLPRLVFVSPVTQNKFELPLP